MDWNLEFLPGFNRSNQDGEGGAKSLKDEQEVPDGVSNEGKESEEDQDWIGKEDMREFSSLYWIVYE